MIKNKILLVGIDQELANLIKKTLKLNDWECVICANLEKILKILETEYDRIACFLINSRVSGGLGYDIIKEVKEIEKYQKIPAYTLNNIKNQDFFIREIPRRNIPVGPPLDSNKLGSTNDLIDFLKKKWEQQDKEKKDREDFE
ncbi:MAG: hypothetical protein ACFFAS_17980 [Promethearchaeota archaeon]